MSYHKQQYFEGEIFMFYHRFSLLNPEVFIVIINKFIGTYINACTCLLTGYTFIISLLKSNNFLNSATVTAFISPDGGQFQLSITN